MKRKRIIVLSFILLIITLLVIGLNQRLEITYYTYQNDKVPEEFNGYRIVSLSDLHDKLFGDNQSTLLSKIEKLEPDIITITGDMYDKNHRNMDNIDCLLKGLSRIAPVYYVNGNHEAKPELSAEFETMKEMFTQYGIIDLDNAYDIIKKGSSEIQITGLEYIGPYISKTLVKADTSKFNILLYHSSTYFDKISQYNYDLVLTGHQHGGIIRLPLLGGLLGNDATFFPKYDAGMFEMNNSTMIVNRGLGDGRIPRFNNRPEIVCITLQT